jgi:hypothetical protein
LDMTFDLQEGIKLANLINRFKYNHPWISNFYFWSGVSIGWWYGIYMPIGGGFDLRVLSLDAIKNNFPSILDSNNDVKSKFMNYLNSFWSGVYAGAAWKSTSEKLDEKLDEMLPGDDNKVKRHAWVRR